MSPEVDLLRGGATLNTVLQSRDLADFFVPAIDQGLESIHCFRAVLDGLKILHLNEGACLGGVVELGLDLGIDCKLDHGDLHILARLREMHLQEVEALDDAVQATSSLRLITTGVRHLRLVLVVLEQGHEREVYVGRGKFKNI